MAERVIIAANETARKILSFRRLRLKRHRQHPNITTPNSI
jgi:hypothetical protein